VAARHKKTVSLAQAAVMQLDSSSRASLNHTSLQASVNTRIKNLKMEMGLTQARIQTPVDFKFDLRSIESD